MSAVRTESGLSAIMAVHCRDAANVLQEAAAGRVRDASAALKTFFSRISAEALPLSQRGYGNTGGTTTVTSPPFAVTVTGGVAPFTYLWERTDAEPETWVIDDDAAATTTFSTDLDEGTGALATFHCAVTDDTGAVAISNDVSARAINIGGGGLIVEAPL